MRRHDPLSTLPTDVSHWLADLAQHGVADNTRRAYDSDRRYFVAWHRARFGTDPTLPIPEATVVSFIADSLATLPDALDIQLRAGGHKARPGPHTLKTVQRRLVALQGWHVDAGVPSACRSPVVRQLLRRARRALLPQPPQRSQPIGLTLLQQLVATCEDTVAGRRDRALLLVGWCCGGRRRSELAALDVDDVRTEGLRIQRSKTDQAGQGFTVPIPQPARDALNRWLSCHPGTGGVFRRVRRGSHVAERLDAGGINLIVKQRIAKAGLDLTQYSAHGLRSGFLSECERAGVPLPVAMAFTGHRSTDVAVGYIQGTALHQNPVLRLLDQLSGS